MKVFFYRRGPEEMATVGLPSDLTTRVWRPSVDGFPSPGSRRPGNLVWWLFTKLGIFRQVEFAELSIWQGRRMLQRLIVTPRWRRFPFMAAEDLQLGDLWTHPAARRQGLARAAIAEAHRRYSDRFWYVTSADNPASIRLIEACGYRFVGAGRRTSPLGIRAMGEFRLEVSVV